MTWKVKMFSESGDYVLDEDFDTEEEAEEGALEALSYYHQGAEDLEMMGGNEGEIYYDDPEYEIYEE